MISVTNSGNNSMIINVIHQNHWRSFPPITYNLNKPEYYHVKVRQKNGDQFQYNIFHIVES